jgi:hypothetical protein
MSKPQLCHDTIKYREATEEYLWLGEMTRSTFRRNSFAAAEVIGAMLLVLIAIGSFAVIYFHFLPVPFPSPEPHVQLAGYVTDSGVVVLEHVGGETLNSYEVHVEQSDGPHVYTFDNNPWEIGERYYPPINNDLFNEEKEVKVTIYDIFEDGSKKIVFDGILTPEDHPPGPGVNPLEDPMSISTLRTNTYDEDLICFSNSIKPNIIPKTFICNWMVAKTGPYASLTRLLLPFDTQNPFQTKDYSRNNYNGTVNGATWTNTGRLGGAYQFLGDDFISIPYCFEDNTIDSVTIEAWVKTSLSSGTILSYDRNNYCELAVSDGHVKWSTNSSGGTFDLSGTLLINDNQWHLVAATYNATTGDSSIYIDGKLDIYQHTHTSGSQLGSGDKPSGAIGQDTGISSRQTIFSTSFETQEEKNTWKEHNSTGYQQETWTSLRYDTFNSGWGNYRSGGSDAFRTDWYKHEGSHSVCIRDNNGIFSSFNLTNNIDVHTPGYISIKLDFWWMWNGPHWSNGEDWWVQYYNGTSWITVLDTNYPSGYSKDTWYHKILYINETNYNFPTRMNIRFRCDAGDAQWIDHQWYYDNVYIDQIYINATAESRLEYDFKLCNSTTITPQSGLFSIGGSGDFDPMFAAFNRTDIDISGYSSVKLSVWYSYKNTESNDFFGLYYKNNTQWKPIFEINNPTVSGQKPWTQVVVDIPKTLNSLRLQFKWRTTAVNEYMAIDSLEITGIPYSGEGNFTGVIDEIKIYPRVLSHEQLYQDYLCTKDGNSTRTVLVSEEIHLDDSWKCLVTPNDGQQDDATTESNILYVINYGGGG